MKLSEAERGRLQMGLALFQSRLPDLDGHDFAFVLGLFNRMDTAIRAEMQAREEKPQERIAE